MYFKIYNKKNKYIDAIDKRQKLIINNYAQWDRHTKGHRNFETESALWFLKNITYKNENNK